MGFSFKIKLPLETYKTDSNNSYNKADYKGRLNFRSFIKWDMIAVNIGATETKTPAFEAGCMSDLYSEIEILKHRKNRQQ